MRLYHSPTSPFVRKVMVVLHETGQLEEVTLVPAAGTPLDPGSMPLAQNPLGKVPTLERASGAALYDSRVICRYLDDRAATAGDRGAEGRTGPGLYPAPPRLWESLTLESTGDGIMEAALQMVYESRLRPDEHALPAIVEGQWAKVERALDMLEQRWLSHLAGPFDIGQVAVGCALGYLDLRHAARGWRRGRDGLADWAARVLDRPSMLATAPPPG